MDDYIQEEIRKPPTQETCSVCCVPFSFLRLTDLGLIILIYIYTYISVSILILVGNLQCVTGWFSLIVLDILRLRVAVRFLSIYPNPGAKPFLKSKSSRFEKLKRMYLFPEEFKQKGQQVEKG